MNKRILLIFLLVNFFSVKAQENYKDFKYYYIFEDYVSNKPIEPVVNTEVKTLTSEYIIVGCSPLDCSSLMLTGFLAFLFRWALLFSIRF